MRGVQIAEEWKRKGDSFALEDGVARCESTDQGSFSADVCVFVGPCLKATYPSESRCKIKVLDVVDKYLFDRKRIHETLEEYDAIVVNSSYMKRHFRNELKYEGAIKVLLHHSDPRWHAAETTEASSSALRFGYAGSLPSLRRDRNFVHRAELQKKYPIELVDTDQGTIPPTVSFDMDLSLRPLDEDVAKFKTSAKVATAAALGHNIVTTWEEATKDCLPAEYPFALNDTSYEAVTNMFELAARDYEGDRTLWKRGLEMMKEVNERLSVDALALEYEGFLDELVDELRFG
jgi:hypothetical protein